LRNHPKTLSFNDFATERNRVFPDAVSSPLRLQRFSKQSNSVIVVVFKKSNDDFFAPTSVFSSNFAPFC